MITVTATHAARNFASLLDAVEHGETVVVTRDGGFADDLSAVHADLRAAFSDEVRGWPGE